MLYAVSDIKRDVRIAIDQNMTSTALSALGDVDTLSLEEIIESKIETAARMVETSASHLLLDGGEPFADSIEWDSEQGNGSGHIILPPDFMRLVSFKMSDWSMPVFEAISAEDPLYARQKSRYPGVRGCPQRPVVAIVQWPDGLVLEFYSCTAGSTVDVESDCYLPYPKIVNGEIDLCMRLRDAVVYYTAYLTALSVGDEKLAGIMLNISNELMK